MENWHTQKIEDLAHELGTDLEKGLSAEEAASRLEQYGPNELIERGVTSPWKILWEQLTGIMVIMLIISAVISFLLEEYTDAITILIIVVLNAVLGFTQEYRAEQAMAALKKMATPRVKVRRAGHTQEIPAQGLVPGDVIESFRGRIINIHPALLPLYGGKGMYGDRVHKAVIEAGEKESGITIHYVNDVYDSGDIIFQATCKVDSGDTPDSLAAKVHALEYRYFPEVIERLILEDQ